MNPLTFTREHDLPPKWDGRTVEWGSWRDWNGFICPPPDDREPCPACGSVARAVMNAGIVYPLAGETVDVDRVRRTKSGREYVSGQRQVPAWRTVRLHVFRCPDCRHDTVWDTHTDQWWDLDHTDYGPHGSYDTEGDE